MTAHFSLLPATIRRAAACEIPGQEMQHYLVRLTFLPVVEGGNIFCQDL